ncbi:MAG: TetR/AcrR family transcriptional regulator [Acidobacteriota bacterium]
MTMVLTPSARRRLSSEERRRELLELGLELFGETSYDQISTDEIARRAGVSRGLLFHYFGNKRGFYLAVVREASARLLERSRAVHEGPTAPDAQPHRAQLDVFLAFVEDNAGLFTLLMQSGVGVDAEVRGVVDRTRQVMARRVAAPWAGNESAASGGLENAAHARFALVAWIGAVEAAAVEWADHRRTGALPSLERHQLADLLLAMLPPSMRPSAPGPTSES